MVEQLEASQGENISLTRTLALPIFALCLAMLLIYLGPEDPNISGKIFAPYNLGAYHFRAGLRNIAITFGLSCLPGALIGAALGHLLAQNSQLAAASISLLRIGQWAPFVIWWVLVELIFVTPGTGVRLGKYFFELTMSIPAVALGACYYYLRIRHLLRQGLRTSAFASAGVACNRALFISIVLALLVWLDHWVVFLENENVARHYFAAVVLGCSLLLVNRIYRTGIEQSAHIYREFFVADLSPRQESSFGPTLLVSALAVAAWEILSLLEFIKVSPTAVIHASSTLIFGADLWQDVWYSFKEVLIGIAISGILVLMISAALMTNHVIRKWSLAILSLTFAVPMVTLPAWEMGYGQLTLHIASVACLSFFPLLHTAWAIHEEPLLCRIFLAVDQALPYGFAATLYGQMMMGTAGLGFATIVASAEVKTEKAFAIFLITLAILFGLSSLLRLLARVFYRPRVVSDESLVS